MEKKRSKYEWIKEVQSIVDIFESYFKVKTLRPKFVTGAVMRFMKSLSQQEVEEAMISACTKMTAEMIDTSNKKVISDKAEQCVKYFCAICWRTIKNKEEQTIFIDEEDINEHFD